jgi:hypothetical protein
MRNRPGKDLPVSVQRGNLVLNTDKALYTPGEKVFFQMASLDENGDTLCDSNLELSITLNSKLLTDNLPVSPSSTCDPSGIVSNSPDYTTFFKPEEEGTYKITLTNKDNGDLTETEIEVSSSPPDISITRWGPTKIDSTVSNRYPMVITVSANENYTGKVTDELPGNFSFAWYGTAEIGEKNGSKTKSQPIDLKAGESMELKYEYFPVEI